MKEFDFGWLDVRIFSASISIKFGDFDFSAGWYAGNPIALLAVTLYEFDEDADYACLFDLRGLGKFEISLYIDIPEGVQ